jgi:hypothetical protein
LWPCVQENAPIETTDVDFEPDYAAFEAAPALLVVAGDRFALGSR